MRLIVIDSPFALHDRRVIDVDVRPDETAADLLRRQRIDGPEWHLIYEGRAVDRSLVLPPPDKSIGGELIALRMPAGPIGGIILSAIITGIVGAGIGFLINLLLGPPKQPQDSLESAVYGWRGITNTRTQGSPVALIFGDHRVGGQVIAVWREGGSGQTYDEYEDIYTQQAGFDHVLRELFALGQGPLARIGQHEADADAIDGTTIEGMQINGVAAESFADVDAWIRMGRDDQPVIDEFDLAIIARPVDVTITEEWTVYTFREQVVDFHLNVHFPEGLYRVDSSIREGRVQLEVQYRPSDQHTWESWDWLIKSGDITDSADKGLSKPFSLTFYPPDYYPAEYPDGIEPAVDGTAQLRIRRVHPEGTDIDSDPSPEHTNRVMLEEVNEITEAPGAGRNYPGVGLVGVRIRANDQLSGREPVITNMARGLSVPTWTGPPDSDTEPALELHWSRNPAWVLAGLLLSNRYGLGNWIAPDDLIWTSFSEWANWCDEIVTYSEELLEDETATDKTKAVAAGATQIVLTGDEGPFVAGEYVRIEFEPINAIIGVVDLGGGETRLTLENAVLQSYSEGWNLALVTLGEPIEEARARCDLVLDRQQGAWDVITDICLTGRAVPVRSGRKFRVRFEDEQDPVQTFGEGNILVDGSGISTLEIRWRGRTERIDIVEIQFLDRDQNFDQALVPGGGIPLDPADEPEERTIPRYGITRATHARREADYELRAANLPRWEATFEVGLDGLAAESGDVIRIGHTRTDWSVASGRARGTLDAMVLDHDLTLEAGETYKALVTVPGSPNPLEVTITESAGTYPAGTAIATDGAAIELEEDQVGSVVTGDRGGSPFVLGKADRYYRTARITSIGLTPELRVQVSCAEYVPEVYALGGAGCYYPVQVCACDMCCPGFQEGQQATLVVAITSENPHEEAACVREFTECTQTITHTWDVATDAFTETYTYSAADEWFERDSENDDAPVYIRWNCSNERWEFRNDEVSSWIELETYAENLSGDAMTFTASSSDDPPGCYDALDPTPGSPAACTDKPSACQGGSCDHDGEITDQSTTYTREAAEIHVERKTCAVFWTNGDCTGACDFLSCVDARADVDVIAPGMVVPCDLIEQFAAEAGGECPFVAFKDASGCWLYVDRTGDTLTTPGDATIIESIEDPRCGADASAACADCEDPS